MNGFRFACVLAAAVAAFLVGSQGQNNVVCQARTDVVLITDGSTSVSEDFVDIVAWLGALSDAFSVGPEAANVAIVQFSADIWTTSPYGTEFITTTNEDLDDFIDNTYAYTCDGGSVFDDPVCPSNAPGRSRMGEGLVRAAELLETHTRPSGKTRSSCVAVMIGDGAPTNAGAGVETNGAIAINNTAAAPYIRDQLGCITMMVAVDLNLNSANGPTNRLILQQVSSPDPTRPGEKLFFEGTDFSVLQSTVPTIQREACVCTDECSGHGLCGADGKCVCDLTYYGEACESTYTGAILGSVAALGVLAGALAFLHRFLQTPPVIPEPPPMEEEPVFEPPMMIEPSMDTDANAAGAPPAMDNRPLYSPASRVVVKAMGSAGVSYGNSTFV